jgi:metallo-beta-lactamase family protein
MACDATPLYLAHPEDHGPPIRAIIEAGGNPFSTRKTHFATTVEKSKAIADAGPCIIVSASGMATGGRVIHHLRRLLPDARNTVLFAGFQAQGTRGRRLVDGEETLKMFGQWVPVRAEIRNLRGLSAHGDAGDLAQWLEGFSASPPKRTFAVHGEASGLTALARSVRERGWKVDVPEMGETVTL